MRLAIRIAGYGLLVVVLLLALWIGAVTAHRVLWETKPARTIAPASGQWIPLRDGALFTQAWGPAEAPTVLLVHGTGAWSGTWFGTPDALVAQGWHVVAVDLPPFGFSTFEAGTDYSRQAQAKRLVALVDALGAKPLTIVGHSFGAGPSLEAAISAPDRFRQLILVDPALGLGPQGEAAACEPSAVADALLATAAVRTTLISAAVTPPRFSAHWLRQFVSRTEVVVDETVAAYQVPFPREGFSARLGDWAAQFSKSGCESARSLRPDQIKQWAQIGLPVTLLWGEQDSITPLAQARSLQTWIGQAQLRVLPGVGHIPHIEDPRPFNAALVAALLK